MIALLTLWVLGSTTAVRQAVPSAVTSRPCPSSWNVPAFDTKKKRPKNAARQSPNTGACIELSSTALDIQEYLQSYSRNQHWTIVEEHMTEDSWTFSLALSKEELRVATKEGPGAPKVDWRSGIALVQVSSTPVADGFTRTVVRASFRGYGENADQFAVQREYWELESNGSFEASVISALKARFQSAQ